MAIIPTVRCTSMKASIAFYTKILDFELSSHRGDGTVGQAIVVQTDDIEALFR
jgi:catechol 2,3-dioxygenase-like lactoylglutathione lyase family enzyme